MKTIEFIALPGAGKSTIQKLLIKQLQDTNNPQWLTANEAFYQAARKNIDIHLRLFLKLTPPSFAIKLIEKINNRSQWQQEAQCTFLAKYGKALAVFLSSEAYHFSSNADRQKVILAFLQVVSQQQCIQDHGFIDKNILYDEGLIQKSIMFIPANGKGKDNWSDSGNINEYLKCIPKPDILIFIKTSVETSLKRMYSRPTGLTQRLKSQNKNEICTFLTQSMNHFENTVSRLQEENKTHIITIENNSTPETATKSIIATMEKLKVRSKRG